jgi:hypothetical protein
MTEPGAHAVEVVSSFLEGGWRAECSCGWKGERYTTTNAAGLSPANQASHDAIRHRPAVTSRRATGRCAHSSTAPR